MFRAFAELTHRCARCRPRVHRFSFLCASVCCRMATGASSAWAKESRVAGAGGKARMRGHRNGNARARRVRRSPLAAHHDTVGIPCSAAWHRAIASRYADFHRLWLSALHERLLPCEGVRRHEIRPRAGWRWAAKRVDLESGACRRAARHGGHRRGRRPPGCRRPPGGHDLRILLQSAAARNAAPCGSERISPGEERGEYRRAFSVTSAMVDAFVLTTLTLLPIYRLSKTEKGPPRRFQNQHDASRRFRLSSPLSLLPFCNAATRDALTQHTRQDDTRSCAADGSADRRYTKQHSLGGAEFLFAGDARRNAPGQHGVNKNSLVKGISK